MLQYIIPIAHYLLVRGMFILGLHIGNNVYPDQIALEELSDQGIL